MLECIPAVRIEFRERIMSSHITWFPNPRFKALVIHCGEWVRFTLQDAIASLVLVFFFSIWSLLRVTFFFLLVAWAYYIEWTLFHIFNVALLVAYPVTKLLALLSRSRLLAYSA